MKKDPVQKAEEYAARQAANSAKQKAKREATAERKAERFASKAANLEARWGAEQKLRDARNAFRSKHPDFKPWYRRAASSVAGVLDSITGVAFIKGADRGILAALAACVIACYGLDLLFFGSKAPDWYLVPLFILIGFVFRTIAIAAGVMLESLKDRPEERRARITWRIIFVGTVAACMISAISFFVGGYQKMQSGEDAITTVASTATGSVDAQIAALDRQADAIRSDLAVRIAPLNAEITRLDTDGKRNEELANTQKRRRKELEDAADRKIDAIDAAKLSLITDRGAVETNAARSLAEADVNTSTTWAAFSWFSKRSGAQEQDVVDFGMLFLALLIEVIAAFGPGAYYGIHRKFNAIVKKMTAMEAEEIAHLDAEVAQIEQRTSMARAMAAAARTAELDDDEAIIAEAKKIEDAAARELALAESEARAKELRAKADAIRNPPPKSQPANDPTAEDEAERQRLDELKRRGDKGRDSKKQKQKFDFVPAVPVDDWSDRWLEEAA